MGFFGFGKKKSDVDVSKSIDSNSMQLPTIDGKLLDNGGLGPDSELDLPPMIDESTSQGQAMMPSQTMNNSNSQQNPTYMPQLDSNDDTMTIDDSEIVAPTVPISMDDLSTNNGRSTGAGQGYPNLNSQLDSSYSQPLGSLDLNNNSNDPYEDVNKLFISDDWKEPEWNSYDPYSEDKIDMPTPKDFGMDSPPSFEDSSNGSNNNLNSQNNLNNQLSNSNSPFDSNNNYDQPMNSDMMLNAQIPQNNSSMSLANNSDDISINEPLSPIKDRPKSMSIAKPVELYIRGKAYAKVFTELDQINVSLSKIDSRLGNYEDLWKREEPLILASRDQMEYLYKKLSIIDKKVFTN